ncbi:MULTISPECIES: hypothetical protein [unclassified Pseudomonas]|uniref:hypothetical protein n=1 Tax=unclassified Pseudomonas TaxID=196821 RepID=UPI0013EE396D|nr:MULTISPECIES: hypothetical protein [unclassified Pseudomonas]
MSEVMQYGLIGLLALAVVGLGVKVTLSYKGGNKVNMKNIKAKGDVVGRDKK